MALAVVPEGRDALARAGDGALRGVGGAGEQLFVDVPFARLAQRLEGCGVASALGQAVAAVAELVRARRKSPLV
jgi:hypothetical protein